jgi:hypothetical protein
MDATVEATPAAGISSLDDYLAGRKQLIASREVLFSAARTYLRPGQRPDAVLLGDPLAGAPARDISEEEWVVNAARGYLTILQNPAKGRNFRICVLQQGHELRVGVRLPVSAPPAVRQRLAKTFGQHTPSLTELGDTEVMLDWHFNAAQLYTNAQALEDAVYRISALFESTLQVTTK